MVINKRKILVTGGGGLVGSAIKSISTEYKKFEFIFIYHNNHDLTNEAAVKSIFGKVKPDFVIHTAAFVGGIGRNIASPGQQFYRNILMNSFVTHYAYLTGVSRLLSFSSVCAFPENISEMREDCIHDGAPHDAYLSYAYSKRMVDVQIRAYNKEYGTKYCTVIPGNIYGKRDNFNLEYGHVIPSLVHKCYLAKRDNQPFVIWGDGSVYREFLYSDDVARVMVELLDKETDLPPSVIVSGKKETQIKDLVKIICDTFDYHQVVWDTNKPNGQLRRPTNKNIFEALLPDFSFTNLETGVQKTVDWFIKTYPDIRL